MNNLSLELADRQTLILTLNPNREVSCMLTLRKQNWMNHFIPGPPEYQTSFILDLKQKQQVADFLTQK